MLRMSNVSIIILNLCKCSGAVSEVWTAWDICDGNQESLYISYQIMYLNTLFIAWAEKRQYFTAKASRLDTYRAGNLM